MILALDASALSSSACLLDQSTETSSECVIEGYAAENLLLCIEKVLAILANLEKKIQAIAITTGPGSFTGLRTACATAQGLMFAENLPIYALTLTQACACNLIDGKNPKDGSVAIYLPANKREYFVQKFRLKRKIIVQESDLEIIEQKKINSFAQNAELINLNERLSSLQISRAKMLAGATANGNFTAFSWKDLSTIALKLNYGKPALSKRENTGVK